MAHPGAESATRTVAFTGNMVALVTPFRNGQLDRAAFARLIERVIDGGVSAIVPCGTTGESPTLSHDEHDEVVRLAVQAAAGRVTVIAGAGSNSTAEAVRLTRAAAENGADAVLSVSPYYNKPTQEGLVRHFSTIADATDLPVVLYDIPGRCGVALAPDTVQRLAEHPRIRAIKVATGNVEDVSRITRSTGLAALSGDDSLTLPMLSLGAVGVISVISNLLPARMTRLVAAALEGDYSVARREHDALFPLMKAMFLESNPAPVKAALAKIGYLVDELRAPLVSVSPAARVAIESELAPFLDELKLE
ncbi:MAG: 4-hydroxy-tetrahydrodipicolinate synthase [Planctomycetes bacterium]|nr:4-hydroxy-tetrahydrodipicolinate synthase [Planctomycetota bacterium]MCB9869009.1 4-hydroxy-tetrahydrodipicolinate synthase [Planctomycetota bacterium]MCB9887969.1 4-hydroxy-tetrahydrodipicolinate synthase [Planctomycetota bacterium]